MKREPTPSPTASHQRTPVARWISFPSIVGISIGGTLLTVLSIFILDAPLSKMTTPEDLPGEIRRAVHLSEAFAHGSGVLMILGSLFCAMPAHRKSLGIVAVCAYGSGLLAGGIKLLIPRLRPLYVDREIESGVDTFLASLASPFPPYEAIDPHSLQSFPSAHAATAIGLAWGLSYFFPRGIPAFFTLAALASFQRFFFGAHWPSDIVAGLMIGSLWSFGVLHRFAPSRHSKPQTVSLAEPSIPAPFGSEKRVSPKTYPTHCEPALE